MLGACGSALTLTHTAPPRTDDFYRILLQYLVHPTNGEPTERTREVPFGCLVFCMRPIILNFTVAILTVGFLRRNAEEELKSSPPSTK